MNFSDYLDTVNQLLTHELEDITYSQGLDGSIDLMKYFDDVTKTLFKKDDDE